MTTPEGKYSEDVWRIMRWGLGLGAVLVVIAVLNKKEPYSGPSVEQIEEMTNRGKPPEVRELERSSETWGALVGAAMAAHRRVLQTGDDAAIRALHAPDVRRLLTRADVARMRAAAKARGTAPFGQVIIEVPADAPPYAKIYAKKEDRLVVRLVQHDGEWLAATPWFEGVR